MFIFGCLEHEADRCVTVKQHRVGCLAVTNMVTSPAKHGDLSCNKGDFFTLKQWGVYFSDFGDGSFFGLTTIHTMVG